MEQLRAHALIELKAIDEGKRTFTGVASTITVDRMGDIVEPQGAEFKLPLPLLWQHDKNQPIGWIRKAKVFKDHIEVQGEVANIAEPPSLKDELDKIWAKLKAQLVRGLSIGFVPKEWNEIKGTWGLRFTKWDWIELSAVTIPANSEANIQVIRSLDAARLLAVSGAQASDRQPTTQTAPAVAGQSKGKQMNIQESIASFELKRKAATDRMEELFKTAVDDGNRTLTKEEQDEYDQLETDVAEIDKHLKRARQLEKTMVSKATEVRVTVDRSDDNPAATSAATRQNIVLYGKSQVPKGTAFTRYCMALARAKGVRADALDYASQWKDSTPEVFASIRDDAAAMIQKAAMTAGTTTDADWAEPLVIYQNMASEFIDLLRPATILGRMGRLRRVPFNISVAGKTQGSTVGWVGQGKGKPVSELAFNEVTLGFAKAAGIVVITEELARFSTPSAEALIRQDMIDTMAQFLDEQFIDPSVAAVANVSPASILNGVAAQKVSSTGSTVALVTADVKSVFDLFAAADVGTDTGVWVMRPSEAIALSMLRTSQDVFAFPTINAEGGTWFGYPVITSNSVPYTASGGAIIAFIKQNEIFVADEGGVRIDVSNQASLQMDSAPSDGAQSLVSLWQNNLIGIRAERFINWQRRRDTGVAYIDATHY